MNILRISSRNNNPYIILGILILISLVLGGACLISGSADIPAGKVFTWITGNSIKASWANILLYTRLPRIIAAYLCGGALALSGMLLQTSLNNVLASPGIVGMNSGAGFCVVLASVIFPASFFIKIPMAFLGAMGTAVLVYLIASKINGSKTAIIMVGIALSSLMVAGIDLIVTLVPDVVPDRMAFYIGGFGGIRMDDIQFVFPWIIIGLLGAFALSPGLNVLLLGDESAGSLGLNSKRYRFLALIFAAMLAAGAISIGGLLGFVGLIVPHMVRFIFGMDHRRIIPFSFFSGGIFLLLCDTVARSAFAPYEIPVGILLSFAGVPFFIYLLTAKRRRLEV